MTDHARRPAPLAAIAVLLVACSGGGGVPSSDSPAVSASPVPTPPVVASPSGPASPTPAEPSPSAATPEPSASPPAIDAAWAQAELTDVATGETFRIADLAGRTIIVETMAIWCVNCLAQQGEVYAALDDLDPDRVSYVLLDVDPSETGPALAEYRERNGFTGTYAIATRDVARALVADFGDQVVNPPATPMILIASDGQITAPDFRHKSAGEIVELARSHGA